VCCYSTEVEQSGLDASQFPVWQDYSKHVVVTATVSNKQAVKQTAE